MRILADLSRLALCCGRLNMEPDGKIELIIHKKPLDLFQSDGGMIEIATQAECDVCCSASRP